MGGIKRLFGGRTGRDQRLDREFEQRQGQQYAISNQAATEQRQQGSDLLSWGRDTLSGPVKYYQALAGGDRNAIMQLLGGQLDDAKVRSGRGLQEAAQFAPRGGVVNRIGEYGQGERSDIFRAILGLRDGANATLGNVGQALLGQGASLLGNAGQTANQTANNLLGVNQMWHADAQARTGNLFSTLSGIASVAGFGLGGGFGSLAGLLGGGAAAAGGSAGGANQGRA